MVPATAVILDTAGERAFIANTFADSITVIDFKRKVKTAEISLGKRPKLMPSEARRIAVLRCRQIARRLAEL